MPDTHTDEKNTPESEKNTAGTVKNAAGTVKNTAETIKNTARRRIIIRLILVLLWIGCGVLLFIFNRGHTLLVDNRNLENPELRAPDMITVFIDNQSGLEFFRGDRDRFQVAGTNHRIYIEFSDGAPPFESAFSLPIRDDVYILSIPGLMAGLDNSVEVFHSEEVNRAEAAAARAAERAEAEGSPDAEEIPGEFFNPDDSAYSIFGD
jgi:hypothetical protein